MKFKYLSRDFDINELQRQYELHWHLPEYKYFTCEGFRTNYKKEDFNGWQKDLFGIMHKGVLAGFVHLEVDYLRLNASIYIILFKKWLNSGLGVRAMLETVDYCFYRGYKRVSFCCAEGNTTAKKIYDSSTRIGGRYIGYKSESFRTMTGEFVDSHMYEILKKNHKPFRS